MADAIIINKENSAKKKDIQTIVKNAKEMNPKAVIIHADSIISLKNGKIKGKRAVVVEDGPTLTHGGMSFGAGYKAATKHKADIINIKKYTVGSIRKTFKKYKHLDGRILPAMGYSKKQIRDLEKTINNAKPEIIVSGTPIDLSLVIKTKIPILQARYELKEKGNNIKKVLKKI